MNLDILSTWEQIEVHSLSSLNADLRKPLINISDFKSYCSLIVMVIFLQLISSMFETTAVATILTLLQFSNMIVLHLPSTTIVVSVQRMTAQPMLY